MNCEPTGAAETNGQPLQNLPVGGSPLVEVNSSQNERRAPCPESHVPGASEFHADGRLCDEWLWNLERGHFTHSTRNAIRSSVLRDQIIYIGRPDMGQLIRLNVSLSKTLPQKRWSLQKFVASLGPLKGKARFEQEFGDANEKK